MDEKKAQAAAEREAEKDAEKEALKEEKAAEREAKKAEKAAKEMAKGPKKPQTAYFCFTGELREVSTHSSPTFVGRGVCSAAVRSARAGTPRARPSATPCPPLQPALAPARPSTLHSSSMTALAIVVPVPAPVSQGMPRLHPSPSTCT